MYVAANPYNLGKTLKMHERCSHCGTRYQMEPNFFFGAMYVSYALAVMVCVFVFAILFGFLHWSIKNSFIAIIVSLIAVMPIIARLSRNIYINFFMSYDPSLDKRV